MGLYNNIKVKTLLPKEVFEKLHKWGSELIKKKGLKEKDLQAIIKKRK